MRKQLCCAATIFAFFAAAAFAQDEPKQTLFINVNVFDGKSESLAMNQRVLVENNLIKSIGDEANLKHNTAEAQAAILQMQDAGECSGSQAKEIYEIVLKTGRDPAEIAEAEGLKQVSDSGAIEAAIDDILANNEDKVEQYKGGKDKLFGFFVGQTMKAMKGQANPQVVNEILRGKLDG